MKSVFFHFINRIVVGRYLMIIKNVFFLFCLFSLTQVKANNAYYQITIEANSFYNLVLPRYSGYCTSPVLGINKITVGDKEHIVNYQAGFTVSSSGVGDYNYLVHSRPPVTFSFSACEMNDFKQKKIKINVTITNTCRLNSSFDQNVDFEMEMDKISGNVVMLKPLSTTHPSNSKLSLTGGIRLNVSYFLRTLTVNELNNCDGVVPKSIRATTQPSSWSVKWWEKDISNNYTQIGGAGQKTISLNEGIFKVTAEVPGSACILSSEFNVSASTVPQVSLGASTRYRCQNERIELNSGLTASELDGVKLFWYKEKDGYYEPIHNESSPMLIVNEEGTFKLVASNGSCKSEATAIIVNRPSPDPYFSASTVDLYWGENVALSLANSPGSFSKYSWSNGSKNPVITVEKPGKYSITVSNEFGCAATASVNVMLDDSEPQNPLHDGREGIRLIDQVDLYSAGLTPQIQLKVEDLLEKETYDRLLYNTQVNLLYNRSEHTDILDNLEADFVRVGYIIRYDDPNELPASGELYLSLDDNQPVYHAMNLHRGAKIVFLEVTDITFFKAQQSVTPSEIFQKDFRLELVNKILFQPKISPVNTIANLGYKILSDESVRFFWKHFHGAYEYEFEYFFIDKYTTSPTTGNEDKLFKEQGIRLSTYDIYYDLYPTFPEGKLYYRVRPVGYHLNSVPATMAFGQWSASGIITISPTGDIQPFEPTWNWEKTLVFAEGGKKKEVISFYDKMLRMKQVATHLSSDKLTLFAETFYDHEGRPVVNTLPVPFMDQQNLKFRPQLHLSDINPAEEYSKQDFDFKSNLQGKVYATSGAAKYYSLENELLNTYKKADLSFLPAANGAVTTQVRYSLDGTGRVTEQSGVGEKFSLSNIEKRFSRMFYGTPSSTELQRMFGTNVGAAVFYKKNMAIDPNGQISISYLDAKGNVIATCLAGEVPLNLEELDNYQEESAFTISLNENNKKSEHSLESVTHATILNTHLGPYTFNYSLDGIINKANTGAFEQQPVCVACTYELEISIIDPEGRKVPLEWSGMGIEDEPHIYKKQIKPNTPIECSENESYPVPDVQFTANFNEYGNYIVTKRLKLADGVIDMLIAKAQDEGVLPDYETFLLDAANSITEERNPCTCEGRCNIYVDELMKDFDPDNEEEMTESEYRELRMDECMASYCTDLDLSSTIIEKIAQSECDGILEQIKSQLSPGGPFFESVSCHPATYVLLGNYEPENSEFEEGYYKEIYASLENKSNSEIQEILTNKWDDSIATLFAPRHREYGHYQFCLDHGIRLNKYQYEMSKVNDWPEAISTGFIRIASGANTNKGYPAANDPILSIVSNFTTAQLKIEVAPGANYDLWRALAYEDYGASLSVSPANLKPFREAVFAEFISPDIPPLSLLPHNNDPGKVEKLKKMKWDLYKGIYFARRYIAIANYKRSNNIVFQTDENTIVEDLSNLMNGDFIRNNHQNIANDICKSGCDGNARIWLGMLIEQCSELKEAYESTESADIAQINYIVGEMQRICKTNCGNGYLNPMGALHPEDETVRQTQINQILALFDPFSCVISQETKDFIFPKIKYEYFGSDQQSDHLEYLLTLFAFGAVHTGQRYIGQSSDVYFSEDSCQGSLAELIHMKALMFACVLDQNCEYKDRASAFLNGEHLSGTCPVDYNNEYLFRTLLYLLKPEDYKYSIQSTRVKNGFDIYMNMLNCYDQIGSLVETGCDNCMSKIRFYSGAGDTLNVSNNAAVVTLNDVEKAKRLGIPFTLHHPALFSLIDNYRYHQGNQIILDPNFSQGYSATLSGVNYTNYKSPSFYSGGAVTLVEWEINNTIIPIGQTVANLGAIIEQLNIADPDGGWYTREEYGSILKIYGGGAGNQYGNLKFTTPNGTEYIPLNYHEIDLNQVIETFATQLEAQARLSVVNAQRTIDGLTLIDDNYSNKSTVYENLSAYFKNLGVENETACDCVDRYTMTGGTVKYCYFPNRVGWFPCSETTCNNANNVGCNTVDFDNLTMAQSRVYDFSYYYLISNIPVECDPVAYPNSGTGRFAINIACDPEQDAICEQFDFPPNAWKNPSDPCFICAGAVPTEVEWLESCINEAKQNARDQAKIEYQNMVAVLKDQMYNELFNKCMNGLDEDFNYSHRNGQYHYTLYYYDQANHLVQTVPPEGVDLLSAADFADGKLKPGKAPQHRLPTNYQYNSRGQVVRQISPDGGESRFWYNRMGQLRFSQNAKQALSNKYSFTVYDKQGRISHVGEYDNTEEQKTMDDPLLLLSYFPFENGELNEYCSQITETQYDFSRLTGLPSGENLRNRVAVSLYYEHPDDRPVSYNIEQDQKYRASLYDYDEIGNVKNIWQIYKEATDGSGAYRKFLIHYDFDLYSGKVNKVEFRDVNRPENLKGGYFYHRYEYDSDNRITAVFSSRDGYIESCDARYYYYPHGPLARVELGHDQVQSLDYAYTLQGWLKFINAPERATSGNSSFEGLHQYTAMPEYSVMLGYFREDYTPVSGNVITQDIWQKAEDHAASDVNNIRPHARELYNGNIAWMETKLGNSLDIRYPSSDPSQSATIQTKNGVQTLAYNYDQLNRIKGSQTYAPQNGQFAYKGWYDEKFSYDANGNIKHLTRYALGVSGSPVMIDNFDYHYNLSSGHKINNRLNYVHDQIASYASIEGVANDIEQGQNSGNYDYDEIGNLIEDVQEGIHEIVWNTYGKISEIHYLQETNKPDLAFLYDPTGNRIAKIVIPKDLSQYPDTTFYVRDAQGNALYTETRKHNYSDDEVPVRNTFISEEYNLYGSSRLGMYTEMYPLAVSPSVPSPGEYYKYWGKRQYELSNHLGNVLATVSDLPIGINNGNSLYVADLLMTQDYYPFGMLMPGRAYEKGQCVPTVVSGSGRQHTGNDFNIGESSADEKGIRDWQSKVFLVSHPNQLRLGELSWYDRSGSETPDGALRLRTGLLGDINLSLGVKDVGFLPAGAYRLSMDMFGTESIDMGIYALVRTSDITSGSFQLFGDEEEESGEDIIDSMMLTGGLIGNQIHHGTYFTLPDSSEFTLLIIGSEETDNTPAFLVDNIRLERLSTLSTPVSTIHLNQNFAENAEGWRAIELGPYVYSHLSGDRLVPTGDMDIDSLTGQVTLLSNDTIDSEYILLARDFEVVPGKSYKIGFHIDSIYAQGMNLKISETSEAVQNIWWNNKVLGGVNEPGYFEYEVKANTESLTVTLFRSRDNYSSDPRCFSVSGMTLTECNTITPQQHTEIYSDSFAQGSLSGFEVGYAGGRIEADSVSERLVVHPSVYVDSWNSSVSASYVLLKEFVLPEYGKYRMRLRCTSSGSIVNTPNFSLNSVRNGQQYWNINLNSEPTDDYYSINFDVYTDTIVLNMWYYITGDSTQLLYISDVELERIYSSDSCVYLPESQQAYNYSWRTSIWSEDYVNYAIPENGWQQLAGAQFGDISLDTLNEQLVSHPRWFRELAPEVGDMNDSYITLLTKELNIIPGKQYQVEFDLELNDSTDFEFLIAGLWRSYLTGIMEPIDMNGFESVVQIESSGHYTLSFHGTTDKYTFEIIGISDSSGTLPHTAYSIANFSLSLKDITDSEIIFSQGFDSLPTDIFSYFVLSGDTLEMGKLSYDTLSGRLRMDVVPDSQPDAEPGEHIGITMKDVLLESDTYYRYRPQISAYGNDLTGVIALTSEHNPENLQHMKLFNVSGVSELVFHSGTGGSRTVLLALITTDSNAHYYIDSLILEAVDINDSVLYANDFSVHADGWNSSFADSIAFTAGRLDWQSEEEQLRIWPWGDDRGILGAITREIDVVPGVHNIVTARMMQRDGFPLDVSLGTYHELSDNVTFETLSSVPYAHVEAANFTDTTLSFTFIPDREKISLVVLFKGEEYSRLILDDVIVASVDPFERDTLLSLTFDDTSDVYTQWRNSFWPDSLIAGDSLTVGLISHDTAMGRMRIDMTEDPFNEDSTAKYVGVVYRQLEGFQTDREYELSYEFEHGGTPLRKLQMMLIPESSFKTGFLNPSEQLFIDSTQIGDSVAFRFTPTESGMALMIIGESGEEDNYYYLDNFALREGWVQTVDCSRNNLQYANEDSRYRFGFNGQERQTELGLSYTTAEYWMYDGRLGRRWNVDPVDQISISNYATFANNPIKVIDVKGDSTSNYFHPDISPESWKNAQNIPQKKNHIVIAAHGAPMGFVIEKPDGKGNTKYTWVTTPDKLHDLLMETSSEWRSHVNDGTKVTIQLTGCNLANSDIAADNKSFVQLVSEDERFKDVEITGNDGFNRIGSFLGFVWRIGIRKEEGNKTGSEKTYKNGALIKTDYSKAYKGKKIPKGCDGGACKP